MNNIKDVIKNRINLSEYFSKYTEVNNRGWIRCPIHNEKTPSLKIYNNRSWYCFGCHSGGDIFNFVMLKDNIDFKTALQKLAYYTGVNIKDYQPKISSLTKVNNILRLRAKLRILEMITHEIDKQIIKGCKSIREELKELLVLNLDQRTAQSYTRILFLEYCFDYLCQQGTKVLELMQVDIDQCSKELFEEKRK